METSQDTKRIVRRNGQKPACEPCRISRLRCDHGHPQCARCVRRGTTNKCYYHPAPLTCKTKKLRGLAPTTSSTGKVPSLPIERLRTIQPKVPATQYTRTDNAELDRSTGVVSMSNRGLPFSDMEWTASQRANTSLSRTGIIVSSKAVVISQTLIDEGVNILEFISSSFTLVAKVIRLWYEKSSEACCGGPVSRFAWYAIQKLVEDVGIQPSVQKLQDASRLIFENTIRPFGLPETFDDLCDTPLRWETIGLFCTFLGIVVSDSQDFYKNDLSEKYSWAGDRHLLIDQAFKMGLLCEHICDRLEQVNDLTLWLLFQATLLATWSGGDDSYRAWRIMGNMASVVFALGFHKGTNQGGKTPRFMVELRRRGMGMAHNLDKGLSIFVGRPPRLSRNYCAMEMPIDISEAVLMGPMSELEAEERRLDSAGWNVDHTSYAASSLRANMLINDFRERVLELSLSTRTENLERDVQ